MQRIVVLLSCVAGVACGDARAQGRVEQGAAGRYQIVNGTPQYAQNIILLDSQTGRTWLICATDSSKVNQIVSSSWCEMRQLSIPTSGR